MGIYDREYYRHSGSSYLDSIGLSGNACKWLIGINILVFILQVIIHGTGRHPTSPVTEWLELKPDRVLDGEIWRLLTYAFLHGSFLHIFFNMLFLFFFGSDVESVYGTKEFLSFYLVSALLGGVGYEAWAFAQGDATPCLGASGAVMAVMVLCACHFPTKTILLFLLIPVPIWVCVLFLVGRDALTLISGNHSDTAVQVHLAGAAFGYAYFKMQWRLTNLLPSIRAWREERNRPRLRVVRPDDDDVRHPVAVAAPPAAPMDEQLEAKVDAVLEKVARTGQQSLTDHERQILLRASELYKRRRS